MNAAITATITATAKSATAVRWLLRSLSIDGASYANESTSADWAGSLTCGSAADPWRTPQDRHRYRIDQRGQAHGQAERPANPRLDDASGGNNAPTNAACGSARTSPRTDSSGKIR
jgi:hypothetical protein